MTRRQRLRSNPSRRLVFPASWRRRTGRLVRQGKQARERLHYIAFSRRPIKRNDPAPLPPDLNRVYFFPPDPEIEWERFMAWDLASPHSYTAFIFPKGDSEK